MKKNIIKIMPPHIIPEYFLLGTICGNRGRDFRGEWINFLFDYYYCDDDFSDEITVLLKNYIKKEFNIDIQIERDEKNNKINLYSEKIFKIIHSYFDVEKNIDLIELLDSQEKICSYLLGSFLRRGYVLSESVYCIDSTFDHNRTFQILTRSGCNKIVFFHTKYGIPGGGTLYFQPSARLRKYFEIISNGISLNFSEENNEGFSSIAIDKKYPSMSDMQVTIIELFKQYNN